METVSSARPLWALQVLIDLKSADPTALTAEEAIRHLLGFGERLISLRRRVLHEFLLQAEAAAESLPASAEAAGSPVAAFQAYLARTVVLWNSNKHRAWLRAARPGEAPRSWEIRPGGEPTEGAFGQPALAEPLDDHLLVWSRAGEAAPEDSGLPSWRTVGYGRAEIYSLRWRAEEGEGQRTAWTEAVGVAASRGTGLLVNPHQQEHRLVRGELPLPVWGPGSDPAST